MDTNCLVKVIDFMKGDCIKSFQILFFLYFLKMNLIFLLILFCFALS